MKGTIRESYWRWSFAGDNGFWVARGNLFPGKFASPKGAVGALEYIYRCAWKWWPFRRTRVENVLESWRYNIVARAIAKILSPSFNYHLQLYRLVIFVVSNYCIQEVILEKRRSECEIDKLILRRWRFN